MTPRRLGSRGHEPSEQPEAMRAWLERRASEAFPVTPPQPPRTEAGPTRKPQTQAGRRLWEHWTDLTDSPTVDLWWRQTIVEIETEAAGAALAALRAQVEAAFAGPSFDGHEGLNLDGQLWLSGARDFHRAVLAIIDELSGAAPAAGERKFHDFSKWEPGVDVRADEAPAAGEPE